MAEQPEHQHSQQDFDRTEGLLLYTTLIPAASAVAVADLIGPPTLPNILLSHCLALWAGFSSVLLFRLKYRYILSPSLAWLSGMITGITMMAIAMLVPFLTLGTLGTLSDWPLQYVVLVAEYLDALPVAARLSSWMTREPFTIFLVSVCMVLFTISHMVAATLGSAIAIWMFPKRPRK